MCIAVSWNHRSLIPPNKVSVAAIHRNDVIRLFRYRLEEGSLTGRIDNESTGGSCDPRHVFPISLNQSSCCIFTEGGGANPKSSDLGWQEFTFVSLEYSFSELLIQTSERAHLDQDGCPSLLTDGHRPLPGVPAGGPFNQGGGWYCHIPRRRGAFLLPTFF